MPAVYTILKLTETEKTQLEQSLRNDWQGNDKRGCAIIDRILAKINVAETEE